MFEPPEEWKWGKCGTIPSNPQVNHHVSLQIAILGHPLFSDKAIAQ
jgi:hypothetical protein